MIRRPLVATISIRLDGDGGYLFGGQGSSQPPFVDGSGGVWGYGPFTANALQGDRERLVRLLGRGAMGVVYEGRDPNLDRRVAIKTVQIENLSAQEVIEYEARFRTEARSAARLQHPNVVSVYDSDRDGDVAFLVMELLEGQPLNDFGALQHT